MISDHPKSKAEKEREIKRRIIDKSFEITAKKRLEVENEIRGFPLLGFVWSAAPKWFAFLGWIIILSIFLVLFESSTEQNLFGVVTSVIIVISGVFMFYYIVIHVTFLVRKFFGGARKRVVRKITVIIIFAIVYFLGWLVMKITEQVSRLTALE